MADYLGIKHSNIVVLLDDLEVNGIISISNTPLMQFKTFLELGEDLSNAIMCGSIKKSDFVDKWRSIRKRAGDKIWNNVDAKDMRDINTSMKMPIHASHMYAEFMNIRVDKTFIENYISMLLYDYFIGQNDRDTSDYDVLIYSNTLYFAPLYDSATIERSEIKSGDMVFNNIIQSRKEFLECMCKLFPNCLYGMYEMYKKINTLEMHNLIGRKEYLQLLHKKLLEGKFLIDQYFKYNYGSEISDIFKDKRKI